MIIDYLKYTKPLIDQKIVDILSSKKNEVSIINSFGPDHIQKLIDFCTNGKTLRGMLVVLGAEMYGTERDENIITLAAILEIIHSCILIQDDIQDDDQMRRGKKTVWNEYQIQGMDQNFRNAKFYGQSMAMDVFLIGHYTALQAFAELPVDGMKKAELLSLLTSEIIKVITAQSQDIHLGYEINNGFDIEVIENVELYKTGRYTLVLPLILGGLYAGKHIEDMTEIERVGEKMGIVFQMKDDELAIFADEAELGKKVGNDICENKKTHFRTFLYDRVDKEEKKFLNTCFGNKNLSERKLNKVRELIDKYKVREDIENKMHEIAQSSSELVGLMNINDFGKENLLSLIDYLLNRTK